jgi:endonuclease/exonuclease/phosphatase family metal-dependent hydrolase
VALPAPPTPRAAAPTIKIATFNVQVFGKAKAFKPDVMSQLATTIHKYDVVALQEVKDISGDAPRLLLAAVNRDAARSYAMLLSQRTGREPDDARSQEQYAILYDTRVIEALDGDRLFDDSARDLFQREPYLAHLRARAGSFSFVLMDIHTRPERAVAEIGALRDVFDWAKLAYPKESNFIALGDYNAACSYATPAQLDALSIRRSDYFWIVPDDSDSNVSPTSACAYDRIVVTAATKRSFTGRWGVDRAFTDKVVSDHWPVWAEFAAEIQ